MATIGDRLKILRTNSGLNQEDFGKQFGIVKSTVSLYENGKSTPDDQTKVKICQHYGVSMDWLYGLEETSHINDLENSGIFIFDFSFSDRFNSLLEESHISSELLCKKTGLSQIQIDNFKNGWPDLKTLICLADFFHTSIDYLLCRSNISKLSNEEEDLLIIYGKCSDDCRRYLRAKAEVLSIEGISAVKQSSSHDNKHSSEMDKKIKMAK